VLPESEEVATVESALPPLPYMTWPAVKDETPVPPFDTPSVFDI